MSWRRSKGPGDWCPENDGAYRAEQAAIHGASSLEDICLWPNGDWCYREELEEYGASKSDDFEVVSFGTPRHQAIQEEDQ
ncbi:hypothetical protein [Roseobacter phage RDJL6]|nr:hypothetical protein [Roseobacter phage RDJL6]